MAAPEPEIPGPLSATLSARAGEVECPAFALRRATRAGADPDDAAPIVLARGEGTRVVDVDGNAYLDLVAGFGSVLLGHGHPALRRALHAQIDTLVQGLGDVYASDVKVALLEQLAALHPSVGAQVLLTQSGADAVGAAQKTATLATGRHGLLAFDGAYHGLAHGPLAACGFKASFREPFAPELSPLVQFCPYPGIRGASLDASLSLVRETLRAGTIGAVLVEPIAGRGGCVVPPAGFLRDLGTLAREAGALLVADEVWTGFGRSGAWLRSVAEGVVPDIVCLGKGLGGGVPISACIASREAMAGWARGEAIHTSTHAGAPLGCSAALAVLEVLRAEDLVPRAHDLGQAAVAAFRERLDHPLVREVRGAGLMLGVELDSARTALRISRELLRRGHLVITGGIDGATLTLTPPLTVTAGELDGFAEALARSLDAA
ncbi:MAG: aspartate aminotransferase family protein [Deltaproteobacteria bacterium]|nr:aspartate aminotransferase family protein [Deltaproteobacteria bacterium]